MKNRTKKNSLLTVVILALFIAAFMSVMSISASAAVIEGIDGSGTPDDPFLLYSKWQLEEFELQSRFLDGDKVNAKLMADIDLNPGFTFYSDGTYSGTGTPRIWTPIGQGLIREVIGYSQLVRYYESHFDGNGYTVRGVYIPDSTLENTGFFANVIGRDVDGASITNLHIENSYIRGGYNVDHGNKPSSEIQQYSTIGGIVGLAMNGVTITGCSYSGTVVGGGFTGGIAGYTHMTRIRSCYFDGRIESEYKYSASGGIAGFVTPQGWNYNSDGHGSVADCYVVGSVAGFLDAGAIIGIFQGGSDASVSNCYYLAGTAKLLSGEDRAGVGLIDNAGGTVSATELSLTQMTGTDALSHMSFYNSNAWIAGGAGIYYGIGSMGDTKTTVYLPRLANARSTSHHTRIHSYFNISTADTLFNYARLVNGNLTAAEIAAGYTANSSESATLTADIDLNPGFTFHSDGTYTGTGTPRMWTPIGSEASAYSGFFNGNGKTISGLYVNSTDDNIGLFGRIQNATVSFLGIENSYIKGKSSVGAIAGYAGNSTVNECYNTGTVAASEYTAGGIVGRCQPHTDRNVLKINNCYNTGAVTAAIATAGGIAGNNYGTVTNCYTVAAVTGYNAGCIAGQNYGSVINCYHPDNSKGIGEDNGSTEAVKGIPLGQMSGPSALSYMPFHVTSAWIAAEANEPAVNGQMGDIYTVLYFPRLAKFASTRQPSHTQRYFYIDTADKLYNLARIVNGDLTAEERAAGYAATPDTGVMLTADIDLNPGFTFGEDGSYTGTGTPRMWTPIGSEASAYSGIFNGNGKKISGLYVSSTDDNIGLFGRIHNATVSNSGIENSYIKGKSSVGAIAGYAGNSTVSGCYNTGTVASAEYTAGGIVGRCQPSNDRNALIIKNCYNTGTVTAAIATAGGIAGNNYGTVTNCYTVAAVTGYNAGCIAGQNYGTVSNCYYTVGDTGIGANLDNGTAIKVEGITLEQMCDSTALAKYMIFTEPAAWTAGEISSTETLLLGETVVTGHLPGLAAFTKRPEITGARTMWIDPADGKPYYLIGSAEGLSAFANIVNGTLTAAETAAGYTENAAANGRLTADIDLNPGFTFGEDGTYTGSGTPHVWTPIGSATNAYGGVFNGGGKTVSGIYVDSTADNVGLFGLIANADIRNLGIENSYIKGKNSVGAIVGFADNTEVSGCYNDGTVVATENTAGGIVGRCQPHTDRNVLKINNCYNTGTVSALGSAAGGIAGDNYGTVSNCYAVAHVTANESGYIVGVNDGAVANCYYPAAGKTGIGTNYGSATAVEVLTYEQMFDSTALAKYMIFTDSSAWTAGAPAGTGGTSLFGETVVSGYLPGLAAFTTRPEITGAKSMWVDPADGKPYYLISSAEGLFTFANIVNGTLTTAETAAGYTPNSAANGKLTADINLNPDPGTTRQWTPMGDYRVFYHGIFNGNGKIISGININVSSNDIGLFGVTRDATILNVGIENSSISGGGTNVGAIVGNGNNTVISGCYNAGAVNSNGFTAGGIVGLSDGLTRIINCYNTGRISAGGGIAGGIVGHNYGTVTNCYATASVVSEASGCIAGSNSGTITNCYYSIEQTGIGTNSGTAENVEGKTKEQMTGPAALSYMIFTEPAAWVAGGVNETQTLPQGGSVVIGFMPRISAFTKNPTIAIPPMSIWVDPADGKGYYLIDSADELITFANIVNGTLTATETAVGFTANIAANAKLTADIDLNPGIIFGQDGSYTDAGSGTIRVWSPIGTISARYGGTFNGNGKKISGVYISWTVSYGGFFGYIRYADILDVGIENSYINGQYYMGGVVGFSRESTISGCYNTGTVAAGQNAGGIVGLCNPNQGNETTIRNCYNTGVIRGGSAGGITSDLYGTITNCYSSATVTGNGSGCIVGSNYGVITNCYYPAVGTGIAGGGGSAVNVKGITAEQFVTGEAARLLNTNGGTAENSKFWAQGASHPSFADTALPAQAGNDFVWADTETLIVYTPRGLTWLTNQVSGGESFDGKTVLLGRDIDLDCGSIYGLEANDMPAELSWKPIGGAATPFCGIFNGQGYTVSGVKIGRYGTGVEANNYQGLFGTVNGTIKNLGLIESTVIGNNWVGGLAAVNNGTVYNCYSDATVYCSGATVGGLVGNNYGAVINCYSTGDVTARWAYVGGIAGRNSSSGTSSGTIKNCYATGAITSGTGANYGALIAQNDGTVENCFYLGSVGVGAGSATGAAGAAVIDGNLLSSLNAWLGMQGNTDYYVWQVSAGINGGYPVFISTYSWEDVGNLAMQGLDYEINGSTYTIRTVKGLAWLANRVCGGESFTGKTVLLGGDINLDCGLVIGYEAAADSIADWKSWRPIGGLNNPFGGIFDGQGHTVSGVKINYYGINDPAYYYQGLFGNNTGTVRNLGLINSTVRGHHYTGGLIAQNSGTVYNCYSEAVIDSSGATVGCLVGNNIGTIENCYSTGNVQAGRSIAGGIAGRNVSGSTGGTIRNCYAIGTVTDVGSGGNSGKCGTLVGKNIYDEDGSNTVGTIENCYYSGSVGVGVGSAAGATGAAVDGNLLFKLNDWINLLGNTEYLTWQVSAGVNGGYPIFGAAWVSTCWADLGYAAKQGTDYVINGNTYTIKTAQGLAWLAGLVSGGTDFAGKTVLLDSDINLDCGLLSGYDAVVVRIPVNTSWSPIGNEANPFGGIFDGQGHTVSGVKINRWGDNPDNNYQGLFGNVTGTLKNLGVTNSEIWGNSYVAGLAAVNSGTISDCYNSAVVRGYGDGIGGVVGSNSGSISFCHNTGYINSSSKIFGGVAGDNNGSVSNCYNTGLIIGMDHGGGIAGRNGYEKESATVKNCYNTGSVTGISSTIGGVCGYNFGTVTGCYNTGSVTSDSSAIGGVCGENIGTVTGCYNTGSVSGTAYVGGVCGRGRIYGTVTGCYYLTGCAKDDNDTVQYGIGNETKGQTTADIAGMTTGKTSLQFNSGEVAWLLNTSSGTATNSGVWSQGADYPVFTDARTPVYYSATLYLQSDISINYYVNRGVGPDMPIITVYDINGNKLETLFAEPGEGEHTGKWKFTFSGISAKEVGDSYIAVCTTGTNNPGAVLVYGVKDYCFNKLNSTESSEALKTLCADLLNYASAAQTYFGYKSDPASLANAAMTDDEKGKATQTAPSMESAYSLTAGMTDTDEKAAFYAVSLLLEEKVSIRYKLTPAKNSGLTVDNTRLAVSVAGGAVQYITGTLNSDENLWFTLDTLKANDMSKTVTAHLEYNGGSGYTPVTETLTYSIESYAARMNKNSEKAALKALVVAMMKYGNATVAYFGN